MIGHRTLNVEDYFALLRRRWWWVLIPAVIGPILGYEASHYVQPLYKSQTLLEIQAPQVSPSFVTPAVPENLLMQRLGNMEEEILSSSRMRPLLEGSGVNGGASVEALKRAIILKPSYSSLETGEVKQPSGFYITCEFPTPDAAQSICADVASMFVEGNARRQERSATETTTFLEARLKDAQQKLNQQDAALAAFKSRYMGDLPDEAQTNLNLLNSATMQLEGVTEALNRTRSDREYEESLLAQQDAAWKSQQNGAVGPEAIRAEVVKLENRLADLEGQYKSDYPDVVDLKSQIAYLRKKADAEEAEARSKPKTAGTPDPSKEYATAEPPLIQQLRNELRLNAQAIQEQTVEQQRLQQAITKYQSRVQLSPAVEEQYREVTRNYQTALGIYNDLLKKLDASKMAADLEQRQDGQQFAVVQPATRSSTPVSPVPALFAAAGFGVGLILGLAAVLLIEFRDKSIWNERDIESCVQLLTLAALPSVAHPRGGLMAGRHGSSPRLLDIEPHALAEAEPVRSSGPAADSSHVWDLGRGASARDGEDINLPYGNPEMIRVLAEHCSRHAWSPDENTVLLFDGLKSAFGTEELRTLRTQLEVIRKQQRIQSLLITSPMPLEGKTFTALNLSLAISCQVNRRLLLIDADMRVPQLHCRLGAPLTPGLSEYLSGNADELSIIQRGARNNFFFIPAGKPVANPSDLIGNGRLKLLLRRMAPAFDWIVLDSPPAVPVSDAQLLAEVCDGVLVIFRAGSTAFDLARRACAQFGEKQLLGVVLNRVKPASAYSTYYQKVAAGAGNRE